MFSDEGLSDFADNTIPLSELVNSESSLNEETASDESTDSERLNLMQFLAA